MSVLFKRKSATPQSAQQNLSEDARQELLLKEAKQIISSQAFQMKRALDANNLTEALKYSSNLINELRTGNLTPKTYYALYIFAMDELRHLENYITDGSHNRSMLELYELIQYAGNILPRLYLMITVGSAFIKKMEAPAKDILLDLVELCRGVQHPTRGLFLRTYLSEMTKDKLPDEGSKYEGDIKDSIDFILVNFTEMNKLWVRMQHGLHNLGKREQEREELNVLVGKNLSRLSQLDGLTVTLYKSYVLPKILDQVKKCKDRIAQNYLMVIIIQAFSDEYHLQTLSQLLETLGQLEQDVKVHSILNSLIVRLSLFCSGSSGYLPTDISLFDLFKEKIIEISKSHPKVTLEGILEMSNSLMLFCLKCYKGKLDYIDNIYDYVQDRVKEKDPNGAATEALNQIVNLLKSPLEHFEDIKIIFKLENYNKVVGILPFKQKRQVALNIVENMVKNATVINIEEDVDRLFNYLAPLVKKSDESSQDNQLEDSVQFASALSLCRSEDVDTMFSILRYLKTYFGSMETIKLQVNYTIVPLVTSALKLIQKIHKSKDSDKDWEKKVKAVSKYVSTLVTLVRTVAANDPRVTFNLYLQCALESGKCGFSKFSYGFLTQGALTVFEESNLNQSEYQFEALRELIGTVEAIDSLEPGDYDNLSKRIAQHATKLSKPENQVRAAIAATWLFTNRKTKEVKFGAQCLNKAVSTAQALEDPEVVFNFLVEILENTIAIFAGGSCDAIDIEFVNKTLQTVSKHLTEKSLVKSSTYNNYKILKEFIRYKQDYKNLIITEIELLKDFDAVKNSQLSKSDAKKEAEKWSKIVLSDD